MVTFIIRLARGALVTLSGIATVLVLFTLMQFNLRGAGLMAVLAMSSFVVVHILDRLRWHPGGASLAPP
ncbi:hypothetical protein [Lichenibacterium dinghuense]|uniref:hypothetical protein n=1 Tax=Lichenibacterium dinghuense TaxID=2895977 RepID=UPI001F3CA5AA|nr:hypothetical protein [Lichenibacterium sp. 6Y81]